MEGSSAASYECCFMGMPWAHCFREICNLLATQVSVQKVRDKEFLKVC